MGFNWDELWDKGVDQAEKAFDDLIKTGAPALQSSLEQWGINVLTEQNKRTQAQLNENLEEVLARPTEQGSYGEALSQTFTNAALNNYGLYIVGGVVGLIIIGMVLKK